MSLLTKIVATIFALMSFMATSLAAEHEYTLATASAGGTYYPVGVALATLSKVRLQQRHGIVMTAVTTAGSAENVRLLKSGESHFAILQGLIGYQARAGIGDFEASGPDRTLRSVTALWPNVEQFVIRANDARTGTIEDLRALNGKSVAFGERNSGTLTSSRILLANLGIDIDRHFALVHEGYGPAAAALQRGDVTAVSLPAGLPTKSLVRIKAAMGEEAVILAFTEAQARRADGGLGLWRPFQIPSTAYPGQKTAIQTIAQPNFLAVRAGVSHEHVYLVTKAIYENLPLLHSMHGATKAIRIETAISGLPMPLHPGAARYFSEMGLDLPVGSRTD